MIKKLFTFLCLCTLCIGSVWGQTQITFTGADYQGKGGNSGSGGSATATSGAITISSTKAYYAGDSEIREYSGGTLTISSSVGTITKIDFTFTETKYAKFNVQDNNGEMKTTTCWTGNSSTVVFKASAQCRWSSIVVTYSAADMPTLESIAISGTPTKTTYEAGEEFDPAGLVVTGTYSEGDPEVITSGITWNSTPNPLTAGTTSVSVTAKVGDITSDAYQVNGLTVTAALPKITITADKIANFASSYAEYTWTVNDVSGKCWAYRGGSSGSYNIQFNKTTYVYNTTAVPGRITSIKMTKVDGTTRSWSVYGADEALTKENYTTAGTQIGSMQEVSSETGTTWNVPNDKNYTYFYITKADGGTNIGEIVITYEEDKTPTIEADVEKIEFEQKELDGTVTDSKTISATGKNLTAAISASMKEGSDAVFSVTPVGTPTATAGEFTVSYSTTVAGEYAGTVVLSSGETSIEIPVSASVVAHIPVLQSIYVKGEPTKKEYTVGDAFETAGLEVWGKYDEGADQQITEGIEWTVDPETFETAGTASVDVMVGIGTFTSEVYTVENITVNEAPKTFTWDLSKDETATATTGEISWTSDVVSMKDEKGSSTTDANNYYGGDSNSRTSTRFYTGSVLTITPVAGNSISKIEFTATSDGYATALQGSSWTNANASAYSKTVTVTPTDGTQAFSATIGATCGFESVKIYIYANVVEIKISAAGAATYSSAFPLDFTGTDIKSYIAPNEAEGTAITMTKVSDVAANTGLYIKGNAGTYYIPVATSGTDYSATNKLKAVVNATSVKSTENNLYNYVLQNQSGTVGFYYLTGARKIGANKAYLQLDEQIGNNAKVELFFDDEPTGIEEVQGSRHNVQGSAYNLNGIRVNENYKGLVIMNGKKYINK